eukprot:5475920-Amphidinium_carterae.1
MTPWHPHVSFSSCIHVSACLDFTHVVEQQLGPRAHWDKSHCAAPDYLPRTCFALKCIQCQA